MNKIEICLSSFNESKNLLNLININFIIKKCNYMCSR